jgi:hypothetical protein
VLDGEDVLALRTAYLVVRASAARRAAV